MFVFSFKASTLKYIGVMSLCSLAIVLTVSLVPSESFSTGADNMVIEVSSERKAGDFKNVSTNDDRVAFLESYGWKVDAEAVCYSEVVIPNEFDKVYSAYNDMQKKEGLDLEKYKGKKVEMYTYKVNNAEGDAYANLLIYKSRVIGGDISSSLSDGFTYGFSGK